MFESYDINNLYKATIEDHGSIVSMENVGGCIGYTSDTKPTYYETILQILGNEMVDINNPKRAINSEIKGPSRSMPRTSSNGHLYTVVGDSIVKYKDTIKRKNVKLLKRTIFGNKLK